MYTEFSWPDKSLPRNVLTRIYEPLQPFMLREMATKFGAEVFLDIGSNIGAYSFAMSRISSVNKIYSFEPAPESFRLLSEAVTLNNLSGVIEAFNLALSEKAGQSDFGFVSDTSGCNSIIDGSIHEREKFERVETVETARLDDIFADSGRRICMKVDVEGHEKSVLMGAVNTLSNNMTLLQVECYDETGGATLHELNDMGYTEILGIGPDKYLSNSPEYFRKEKLLEDFETAASCMIKSNLALEEERHGNSLNKPRQIRLNLGKVTLEVKGDAAKFLHLMREKVRRRHR